MSHQQQTLTGDTATDTRDRPKTLVYDYDADEWILRRKRFDRGISTAAADRVVDPSDEDDDDETDDSDDSDDEPVRAGGLYRVELNYTVRRTFTVPAWSDHEAEERAELLSSVAGELVHTNTREKKPIMTDHDKLPDGYDPEMGTPLWEVWGETDE